MIRAGAKVVEPVDGGLLVTVYPLRDGALELRPVIGVAPVQPRHGGRTPASAVRP